MKESLEQVKKKLKSLDDPNFDQATQMIAYAFTDPGRASIFGISKLGTLAVLLVPILALAASAYGFFRLAQGHHSLASHLSGSLLPLGMVLLSSPIISRDGPAIAGFPIPGVGIFIMIVAQGALFIDGMLEEQD